MSQATELLSIVAEDMKEVEEKMRSGISDKHEDLQAVVDYLVGAGGKRLRPALTLMAANFYPVDKEKSYSLAASVRQVGDAIEQAVEDVLETGALTADIAADKENTVGTAEMGDALAENIFKS